MAVFNDTFTEGSNTTLASHTPDTGTSWALQGTYSNLITVVAATDKASGDDVAATVYYATDDPTSDQYYVEVDIDLDATGDEKPGLVIRATTDSNKTFYLLQIRPTDGIIKLWRNNAASLTALDQDTLSWSDQVYTLKLQVKTNGAQVEILAWRDGTPIVWEGAASATYADTAATRLTARGRGGIWTTDTTSTFDDFTLDAVDGVSMSNEPADFYIEPRSSATVANIAFNGTYQHASADNVQVRIVEDGTDTEAVTWTTIDATLAGGTWSGTLSNIPVGGWYNIDVRLRNSSDTVLDTANGGNRFGVGVYVGVIGQSNASNWFDTGTPSSPDDRGRYYDGATTAAALDGGGTGAQGFTEQVIDGLSCPVAVIEYAVSGTALTLEAETGGAGYWLDTAGASIYDVFQAAVGTIGKDVECVVFIQGERDARSDLVTEAEYETALGTLVTNLRVDLTNGHPTATNLPIILGPLGRGTAAGDDGDDFQAIRNAQYDFAADNDDVYVSSHSIDLALVDGIHLTDAAYTTQGARIGQAVAHALGGVSYSRGPSILGYEQSGTAVSVHLSHRGGSDITPTSGIEGFEAFDDATPITIDAAVRTSGILITLTLNSEPSGTFSLRYLYGEDGGVTKTDAPAALANMVVDNSALALPLEGSNELGTYTPPATDIGSISDLLENTVNDALERVLS